MSVPFVPGWQYFYWYEILKNLVGPLWCRGGPGHQMQGFFIGSFLENPYSWPGSYSWLLLRWLIGFISHMQNLLSKCLSMDTLGVLTRALFPSFMILIDWKFSKSSRFLFASLFLFQFLFFLLHFAIGYKEIPGHALDVSVSVFFIKLGKISTIISLNVIFLCLSLSPSGTTIMHIHLTVSYTSAFFFFFFFFFFFGVPNLLRFLGLGVDSGYSLRPTPQS